MIPEVVKNYYIMYEWRDKSGRDHRSPRISVAVLRDSEGLYHRGLAMCSFEETPVKVYGRSVAINRANLALEYKESSGNIIYREKTETLYLLLNDEGIQPDFKSQYNVTPTAFEKKLFGNGWKPTKQTEDDIEGVADFIVHDLTESESKKLNDFLNYLISLRTKR